MCLRVPGGSRQEPCRAPAGQFTGPIRGLFIAGVRVTFKLELKVTRGPRGVTAKKRPKNSPGTAREGPFCEL